MGNKNNPTRQVKKIKETKKSTKTQKEDKIPREKYKNLLDLVPDAIMTVDMKGFVTSCNKAIEKITGYGKEEIVGNHFSKLKFLDKDEIANHKKVFTSILKGKEKKPFDVSWYHKNGTPQSAEIRTRLVKGEKDSSYILVVARDLTEKRRIEKDLLESEDLYRVLFDKAPASIALVNHEGVVIDCNAFTTLLTGYSKKDIVGKRFEELDSLKSDDVKRLKGMFNEFRKNGEIGPIELEIERKDGEKRMISAQYSRLSKGEERSGYYVISRDITEERRMEEILSRTKRMEVLEQIAAGVSHEVRNPLSVILALAETMIRDLGDEFKYAEFLNQIRIQVERLSVLMQDLLELGKPIDPSRLQKTDVNALCSSAIVLWKMGTSYKDHVIQFSKYPGKKKILVNTDRSRFQQVLLNLLENAAQHSPEGSEIKIIVPKNSGENIHIKIIDQGTGIQSEELERVFEPFFSTRKKGTGLGLSLVKAIIENHGGEVTIFNNKKSPGCTVDITLPVVKE
jgi:PAS domain S-box-containing protein